MLPGGAEGGEAPWTGRLVPLDLVDALAHSAGTYDGDVAGFIGRALPIVDLAAAAGLGQRAPPRAAARLDGGGEVTDGRAVLRVAG